MRGLFPEVMPADRADELAKIMREARPAATRTMAHALAEAGLGHECYLESSVRFEEAVREFVTTADLSGP